MERTGRISKLYLIILLFSMIAITMSGCVYVNNKNWDDMTPEEQEEVRQNFEEERKELEEDFWILTKCLTSLICSLWWFCW